MATRTVTYSSKVWLPIIECQDVALCLLPEFAALTVSGKKILLAKSSDNGRFLGPVSPMDPEILWKNPRKLALFQYTFTFDDTQFTIPRGIACSDIASVFDACIASLILPLT